MNLVGTRSTASETTDAKKSDVVERDSTESFHGPSAYAKQMEASHESEGRVTPCAPRLGNGANGAQGTDAPYLAGCFMATVRDFEIVENLHGLVRDAFHRVRNRRRKKSDAVERVPTIFREFRYHQKLGPPSVRTTILLNVFHETWPSPKSKLPPSGNLPFKCGD